MSCQVCNRLLCRCRPRFSPFETTLTPDLVLRHAVTHSALLLSVAKLREIAGKCPGCAGAGVVSELFAAYVLTDDGRLLATHWGRHRAKRQPKVRPFAVGAGFLRTPCPECVDLRQVIETAEKAL